MREIHDSDGVLLAVIDNYKNVKKGLHFYGSADDFIQVGSFRYLNNKILRDHVHLPRDKHAEKTQEILIVFQGSAVSRTYDKDDVLVYTEVLSAGDYYISYWGGCGFTVLEDDTIMLEIKNGPWDGMDDLERRLIIRDE